MELDSLLVGTKWDIVEILARREASPLEIAKLLQTSIANISMQLKMLEIAGIVSKRRVSNSKAGKPRSLYTLRKDILYVMAASSQFQFRKPLELNPEKSLILKIWQLPQLIQGPLLYFYTKFPQLFNEEYDVYFSEHGDQVIKLIICNDKKSLPPKIVTIEYQSRKYVIDVRFVSERSLAKQGRLTLLHKGSWQATE